MEGTEKEKVTVTPQELIKQLQAENESLKQQMATLVNSANEKLKEMYNVNLFKRVDYLFKVVEHPVCFDQDFVDNCAQEIQQFLIIPKEETETENKQEEDK